MAGGEFDLIRRHFTRPAPSGVLGVGDDCALLPTTPGALAISTDLLVEGRHFFPDVCPQSLGHKALAVNLSDLGAMGASPAGFTLGLALPRIDDDWLAGFARGLYALADRFDCPLIGGDTTRAQDALVITITIFGRIAPEQALRRDGARAGDDVWVSGCLGDADIALRLLSNDPIVPGDSVARACLLGATRRALEWPEPRVTLGQGLRGLAHAAIDVSDGLLQDLGHILAASDLGACLQPDLLPLSPALATLPSALARLAALTGGDAYELCFTAAPAQRAAILEAGAGAGTPVTRIGSLEAGRGVRLVDAAGASLALPATGGFDHFA